MKKLSNEQMANNWGGTKTFADILVCAYKLTKEGESFNIAVYLCSQD